MNLKSLSLALALSFTAALPARSAEWKAEGDRSAILVEGGGHDLRVTCLERGKASIEATFPEAARSVTLNRRGDEGNASAGLLLAGTGSAAGKLSGKASVSILTGFLTDRTDNPTYAFVVDGVAAPVDLGVATEPLRAVLKACATN